MCINKKKMFCLFVQTSTFMDRIRFNKMHLGETIWRNFCRRRLDDGFSMVQRSSICESIPKKSQSKTETIPEHFFLLFFCLKIKKQHFLTYKNSLYHTILCIGFLFNGMFVATWSFHSHQAFCIAKSSFFYFINLFRSFFFFFFKFNSVTVLQMFVRMTSRF